jgi:penicillin-binding protein 1A
VQSTTGDPENLNWPRNYTGPGSGENIPVVDALAQSLNTIAVRVGMRMDEEEMFDFLVNTLDITSLVEKDDAGNTDIALAPLVLGSMTHGITPYELAGAYQMFGNSGVYNTLHCYTEVRDSFDNIVLEPVIAQKQAISESTSYVMNRLLKNVLGVSAGTETNRAGTANGMALSYMDSVAKTGTTTDDKDRWFVGLTPYYVSVVWWGYDQPREMIDANTGRAYSASARTNPPPVMWKTVMEAAQADLPAKDFPAMPTGVRQENFCRATGELATANCTDVQTGYYIEGTRVPNACFIHGGGFGGIPDPGGDAAA